MLIGIVKRNAINADRFRIGSRRKEGKSPAEAIHEGCLIRFRPIMMTTWRPFWALAIALGYGAGGEARRPLGLAVVGGLGLFRAFNRSRLPPYMYTQRSQIQSHQLRKGKPATTARPNGLRASPPRHSPMRWASRPEGPPMVVIMMGRKRMRQPRESLRQGFALFALGFQCEIDLHRGILLHDADQHDQPERRNKY